MTKPMINWFRMIQLSELGIINIHIPTLHFILEWTLFISCNCAQRSSRPPLPETTIAASAPSNCGCLLCWQLSLIYRLLATFPTPFSLATLDKSRRVPLYLLATSAAISLHTVALTSCHGFPKRLFEARCYSVKFAPSIIPYQPKVLQRLRDRLATSVQHWRGCQISN